MRASKPTSSYSGGIRPANVAYCYDLKQVWVAPPDEVEDAFFPFPSDFLDAIHTHIQPLTGYEVKHRNDAEDLMRRSKEGV